MFKRLKEKWKLSWTSFVLVFSTFAIGGSSCGYLGRTLLTLTGIESGILYYVLYIVLMCLLWPLCVIVISIPMGQFGFFRNYLRKMSQTIFGVSSKAPKPQNGSFSIKKRNLALFASGAGSNALKIIEHFKGHPSIRISLIVCNKPGAGVLQIAADNDVPVLMLEKKDFEHGNMYVKELAKYEIDFIVLAGFLWKMPEAFLNAYPRHMINIHPSLLPKYGGKGMYGSRVHEAVIAAGEKESGITIHYVNGQYDEGEHLFQAACTVDANDTPDTLATKVHALEHLHFARVIEDVIEGKL
ncbi:MAG: DUF6787 family protein [Sediminibacterium sp.]